MPKVIATRGMHLFGSNAVTHLGGGKVLFTDAIQIMSRVEVNTKGPV